MPKGLPKPAVIVPSHFEHFLFQSNQRVLQCHRVFSYNRAQVEHHGGNSLSLP